MFCAFLLFTLYLSVAACRQWLAGTRAVTCGGGGGGGNKTTPLGTLPVTPGAGGGGYGSGPSTGDPPLGVAPVTGPPTWQEGACMPAVHKGTPGRGDGPQSRLEGGGGGLAWAVAGGPTLEWGGGGMAGGTAAAALQLPLAPSVTGNVPRPPPPLGGATSTGRADSECRLPEERRGWVAQRLGATASPRRPTPAPRPEEAQDPTPRAGLLAPCRLRPGLVMVVVAVDPALVGFPLGWAREPDPLCGRRVPIRPQPTRAPHGEEMALGPSRWGDPAWAGAGGPTPVCGGGGMAWDPAAAALRLSLALGAATGV